MTDTFGVSHTTLLDIFAKKAKTGRERERVKAMLFTLPPTLQVPHSAHFVQ